MLICRGHERLEEEHDSVNLQPSDIPHSQELSLRSLKAMIYQMKEEIARFESDGGEVPILLDA
jgi:hypothetical protein